MLIFCLNINTGISKTVFSITLILKLAHTHSMVEKAGHQFLVNVLRLQQKFVNSYFVLCFVCCFLAFKDHAMCCQQCVNDSNLETQFLKNCKGKGAGERCAIFQVFVYPSCLLLYCSHTKNYHSAFSASSLSIIVRFSHISCILGIRISIAYSSAPPMIIQVYVFTVYW